MKPGIASTSSKASGARNEMTESANTLLSLLDLKDRHHATISSLLGRLHKSEFNLVIVGQFKRGKSTLANCFMRKALLPSGVVPLTSVITEIRFGDKEEIEVHHKDGRITREPAGKISSFVTEAENPKNRKNIRKIVLLCRSDFLGKGIVLIDTPGIGSTFTHNTEVTKSFLPNCDAVVFVISSDSPLSTEEISFIIEAQQTAPKMFFVLNKSDYVSDDELGQLTAHIRTELGRRGIHQPLYPTSAKLFIESHAKKDGRGEARSGIPALEKELVRFLLDEKKEKALLASARIKMCNASDSLYNVLSSELAGLKNDIKTTNEKIALFEGEATRIRSSVSMYNGAIDEEFSVLMNEISGDIENATGRISKRISAQLKLCIAKSSEASNSKLTEYASETLGGMIDVEWSSWWRKEDAKVHATADRIGHRYSEMLNRTKTDIGSAVSGIFSFRTKNMKANCRLDMKTLFYFKVDGFSSDGWTPDFSLMLPNSIFKKNLLGRVEAIVEEEVDRNSGRIRYDYLQKLEDGKARLKEQFQSSVEEMISEIEEGLRMSRAASLSNASARKARLMEVKRKLKDLAALSDKLGCEK